MPEDLCGCIQAGLKTGMYYLRTRAAADAIKFTVDQQALAKNRAAKAAKLAAAIPVSALPVGLKVSPPQLYISDGWVWRLIAKNTSVSGV